MRIAMVASYPPDRCGISDYSERLVSGLRKAGAEIMIVARQGKGLKNERNIHRIISTRRVARSFAQIPEEIRGLENAVKDADKTIELIDDYKPDAVHVQYEPGLYNLFFVPILLAKLKENNVKIVLTLHSTDYFPLNVFHRIFLYNKPDKIIVHTGGHYNVISRQVGKSRVGLIPMGLMPGKPGKDGGYILFFGFLNQHKGIEELLHAFSKVKIKCKLVVIGSINPAYKPDVDYKNRIKKLVEDLKISGRVDFIYNFVPFRELCNYIRNSMFVVFPYRSSYSGSQSQAIVDSIAFGKPLIVTKPAQGNLADNENAIVINPGDVDELAIAIKKLVNSKKLRKSISLNNRKLAKKLMWPNIAKATMRLYDTI